MKEGDGNKNIQSRLLEAEENLKKYSALNAKIIEIHNSSTTSSKTAGTRKKTRDRTRAASRYGAYPDGNTCPTFSSSSSASSICSNEQGNSQRMTSTPLKTVAGRGEITSSLSHGHSGGVRSRSAGSRDLKEETRKLFQRGRSRRLSSTVACAWERPSENRANEDREEEFEEQNVVLCSKGVVVESKSEQDYYYNYNKNNSSTKKNNKKSKVNSSNAHTIKDDVVMTLASSDYRRRAASSSSFASQNDQRDGEEKRREERGVGCDGTGEALTKKTKGGQQVEVNIGDQHYKHRIESLLLELKLKEKELAQCKMQSKLLIAKEKQENEQLRAHLAQVEAKRLPGYISKYDGWCPVHCPVRDAVTEWFNKTWIANYSPGLEHACPPQGHENVEKTGPKEKIRGQKKKITKASFV
eukprot:Nk52_evm56s2118 gene=Nk52_evmTU56s2118